MSNNPFEYRLRLLRRRPLCIICAKPSEADVIAERLQVKENKLLGREIAEINNDQVFYQGSFNLKHLKLDYYITSCQRQGIQSFAIQASFLFQILRPRYTLHAGVCAGYEPADLGLEHVVFGETAVNYEEGKFEEKDGVKVFSPDYDVVQSPSGDMQAFAQPKTNLRYHYGQYISGSAVREDATAIFEKMRSQVLRNVIALDMESSGYLAICRYAKIDSLGVVKGVSDFANADKGKDASTYDNALRYTADALKDWVVHSLPSVNWESLEDGEPGPHLSKGYYKNFIQVLWHSYASELPVKIQDKSPPPETILNEPLEGLKIVLPPENKPNFFAEAAHIKGIVREFHLEDVYVGQGATKRTAFYLAGFLIDFPRTINSLTKYEDATYQVSLFKKTLEKEDLFKAAGGSTGVSLCTWEQFRDWASHQTARLVTPVYPATERLQDFKALPAPKRTTTWTRIKTLGISRVLSSSSVSLAEDAERKGA